MYICKVRFFLFIIITLLVFRPVVPLVDYMIDYEYISTVLCVNTDKPEMQCNGQCYLMQELAKVAKEEQQKDSTKKVCNIAFALLYAHCVDKFTHTLEGLHYSNKVLVQYVGLRAQVFIAQDLRPPLV